MCGFRPSPICARWDTWSGRKEMIIFPAAIMCEMQPMSCETRPAEARPFSGIVNRWCLPGAVLFAAYFLFTSLYIGSHRLLWYDEVFTTLTVRMPDCHTIWRALTEDNSDPSPIGFFVVMRTFDKLFGPGEIGIRIPSALAMAAGMLIVYDCVRRLTDRLHGLIAMAVLSCSYLTYYAYEARCYGLFFLFSSAVLWTWIVRRSPVLLFVLFFGGMLIHYYMTLCMIPFALDEAAQWRPWRRPSAALVACMAGVAAGAAVLLPQLMASRRVHGNDWWTKLNSRQIPTTFADFFPAGLFLLAMIAVWAAWSAGSRSVDVPPASAAERLAWASLLIPLAGYVVAKLVTHAFLNRYFIGILPGVAVGFSCLVWRCFRGSLRTSLGILLLLAGYGIANQAVVTLHPEEIRAYGPAQERTRIMVNLEDQLAAGGAKYIVLDAADLLYLEARYYSKHPERYVWWVDVKPPASRFYPLQYWTVDDVRRHSREAVLVDVPLSRIQFLQEAGYRTKLAWHYPFRLTFLE